MPCPKGMRGCRSGCLHKQMVLDYRDARHAWEENREKETAQLDGPRLEDDEYREQYPPPTFKQWLVEKGGERDHHFDGNDF